MAAIDQQPAELAPEELDAACGGTTIVQTFTPTGTLTIVFSSGDAPTAVFNPNLRTAR